MLLELRQSVTNNQIQARQLLHWRDNDAIYKTEVNAQRVADTYSKFESMNRKQLNSVNRGLIKKSREQVDVDLALTMAYYTHTNLGQKWTPDPKYICKFIIHLQIYFKVLRKIR